MITIDGIPIDMDRDQLPRFSYGMPNVFEPGTIKGDVSTSFHAPATNKAVEVLGSEALAEDAPTGQTLRVARAGNVYYETPVRAIERTRDRITMVSTGNNASWISDAQDLRIADLDMGVSPTLDAAYMKSTWTDTSTMLVFPLINYGQILDAANETSANRAFYMRPAMRVHRLIAAAFNSLGYSVKVTGRLADLWYKLIIPSTTDDIRVANKERFNATVQHTGTVGITPPQTPPLIDLPQDTITADPSGVINIFNFTYDSPNDQTAHAEIRVDLTVFAATFGSYASLPILFWVKDSLGNYYNRQRIDVPQYDVAPQNIITTINTGTFKMVAGRSYVIQVQRYQPAAWTQFDVNSCSVSWFVDEINWQDGIEIFNSSMLPDLSLFDVIKSVCTILCVIPDTSNVDRVVNFSYYDDFLRPHELGGTDLTTRIDHSNPPVKETPLQPIRYRFKYKEESDDYDAGLVNATLRTRKYGDGDHVIPQGVTEEKTISLPFSATAMQLSANGGLVIPTMREHDGTSGEARYNWNPRILIFDGTSQGNWTFNTVAQTEYPRCYFISPDDTWRGLSFEQETYYGDTSPGTFTQAWGQWFRRMDNGVRYRCDMLLEDHEMQDLDRGKPVQIHDGHNFCWCYFSDIIQFMWMQNEVTEIVLIPE